MKYHALDHECLEKLSLQFKVRDGLLCPIRPNVMRYFREPVTALFPDQLTPRYSCFNNTVQQ